MILKSDGEKGKVSQNKIVSKVFTADLSSTLLGISYPLSLPGILFNTEQSQPLFQQENETVLRLNNPHFVSIFCLIPLSTPPKCDTMTILNSWLTEEKYSYWFAVPSNSAGNSKLAWGGSWPKENTIDWRNGGSFDIDFPEGGLYWIESRGDNLLIQNRVIDTRYPTPKMPSKLTVKDIGFQKVRIEWQDNSDNEIAFHILIEQMVGDKWVKLPYQRVNRNTSFFTWQTNAGYYRFAIRSALSTFDEVVSFQRKIPSNILGGKIETVNFTIPAVNKYSEQTDWKYLLVNGNFANPIAPTNFGGILNSDKSLLLAWQDNSNNESAFHIFEETFVNDSWIRLQIRVPANCTSWSVPPKSTGKYRYSIRSAYSFPDTSIVRTSAISNWIEFVIT
jgi:hypothetical protein